MTQDSVLLLAAAVAVMMFTGFGVLLHSLRKPAKSALPTASSTPIRLRPMGRLLNEADFEFLSQQPGYRPEIGRQLRRRRLALFRTYLAHMKVEFRALHQKLRLLALYSHTDRSDLSRLLLEQRMLFGYRMFQIELRLLFFQFGMKPADVSGMVEMVEGMRRQVSELSAGLMAQAAPVSA